MTMPHNRSIPELFSEAFDQLAKLVGNEIALARAELSEKLGQFGRGMAMICAGALLFMPALVLILLAIAAGLIDAGLSEPMAYLATGAGTAVIGGILVWVGVNRISGPALKPSLTIEQLQRDQVAAKEMVR
jgi:hypothetical protein